MALGNNNISVALVKSTIGVSSVNSVGGLIAKASIGGNGSGILGYDSAFKIYETRSLNSNVYDGTLISGAEPHWNRWSRYMPAEWAIDSGELILRLKRNANNTNGGYDFRLHDFRLYNQAAHAPTLFTDSTYTNIAGNMTVSWSMFMYEMAFPEAITHILAKVVLGGSITQTKLIPLDEITHYTGMPPEIPASYSVTFTSVVSSSGTIQMFGSNQYGQELCTLNNIYGIQGFSIQTIPIYASLQRAVGGVRDPYVQLNAEITVPTGSSATINVNSGQSTIGGYTISILGISSTYTQCSLNIYLTHESDEILVTSTPITIPLSSAGELSTYYVSSVTLNQPTAAGDTLSFFMEDLTY